MGLVVQGQAAYTKMAELAEAQGYVESQAQAVVGLGWAACAGPEQDVVKEYWMQAYELYEQHNLSAQAAEIQTILNDIEKRCS